MFLLADQPSLGLVIGLPIAGICVLLCLGWIIVFWSDDIAAIVGGIIALLVVVVITGVAYFPFKHDYHFWVSKSGKVTKIGNRFIRDGDSVSQRYVVVLDGKPYGVDDTRASLVKIGQHVNLKCKKEYDFGSSDNGWACKWGKNNPF